MVSIIIFLTFINSPVFSQDGQERLMGELFPDATFVCLNSHERCGYSMSGAGDVNGDGYDDFMVAAYHNYEHGWNSGGVYLITGKMDIDWGTEANIEYEATAIFRGSHEYDMVGYNVAGKGDFNGDGFDDLLIGGPGTWDRYPRIPGSVYIVFGKEEMDWGKDCELTLHADVKLQGENLVDQLGYANSFVGDINHDGFDDIICSAPYRNEHYKWDGKAYLVLGDSTGWSENDLIAEKAVASFVFPVAEALVGYSVAGVGDVNQDGTPDLVIGVPGANMACLILGRPAVDWGQNFNLNQADYVFFGEFEGDYAGSWISHANDVNNDGYSDFLISAIKSFFDGGRIYLILGKESWASQEISLIKADASFRGEDVETHTGFCTSGLKDYDGDGYDDFLIGARYLNGPYPHSGKMYLIKGRAGAWQHDDNLENIPDYFWGDDSITCAGWQVTDIGDVNGDNAHDFATSGPFNSSGEHWGGKIYFFFGKNVSYQVDGSISYYSQKEPVSGVKLVVDGLQMDSTFTNQEGRYLVPIKQGQTYKITPVKFFEETNESSVSAYDAALVARHAVGMDTLDYFPACAADVDQNQQVGMYDAAHIARYAVELPSLDSSYVGELHFDPPNRFYERIAGSYRNENYTSMILGDVDGNWQGSNFAVSTTMVSGSILPKHLIGLDQKKLAIPIFINHENVLSVDIQVEYDSEQLKFVDIKKTRLSTDFCMIHNVLPDGKIKIAMYTTDPAKLDGDLIRLIFIGINKKKTNRTHLAVSLFRVNNLMPTSGKTTILFVDKKNINTAIELTNQPNPFNPTTKIYYQNYEPGNGKLVIYDMLGKEVRRFDLGYLAPGVHEQFWDGKDNNGVELSSGVYFMKFACGKNIKINKMVKLK